MPDDRLVLKEKIKLRKEIGQLESQIESTRRSKEEKMGENSQVEDSIKELEEENIRLEEEIRNLEEQITELDTEFKEAQLTAGRLRKMIKMANERIEEEEKKVRQYSKDLDAHTDTLDKLRRDIKREVDERKNLEYQLKTTRARIEEMEGNFLARLFVTRRLKKDERFFPKDKSYEQVAAEIAERAEKEREAEEIAREMAKLKKEEAKARAEAKAQDEKAAVESATGKEAGDDELDLSL